MDGWEGARERNVLPSAISHCGEVGVFPHVLSSNRLTAIAYRPLGASAPLFGIPLRTLHKGSETRTHPHLNRYEANAQEVQSVAGVARACVPTLPSFEVSA